MRRLQTDGGSSDRDGSHSELRSKSVAGTPRHDVFVDAWVDAGQPPESRRKDAVPARLDLISSRNEPAGPSNSTRVPAAALSGLLIALIDAGRATQAVWRRAGGR